MNNHDHPKTVEERIRKASAAIAQKRAKNGSGKGGTPKGGNPGKSVEERTKSAIQATSRKE
jgi:hypothetical protein